MEPGACLFADQLRLPQLPPHAVAADVTAGPGAPRLRNFSGHSWTVEDGERRREVASGEDVALEPGLRVSFGDVWGQLRG